MQIGRIKDRNGILVIHNPRTNNAPKQETPPIWKSKSTSSYRTTSLVTQVYYQKQTLGLEETLHPHKYPNIFKIVMSSEFQDSVYEACVRDLKYELTGSSIHINNSESSILTKEHYDKLFSPHLPTLALIYPFCAHGASVIGLASQRQGKKKCNVVIIPHLPSENLRFEKREDVWTLTTDKGILISSNGEFFHGLLPTRIPIDLISLEHEDSTTLRLCEEKNIKVLNPRSVLASAADKADSLQKLFDAGCSVPEFIAFKTIGPNEENKIEAFVKKYEGKVVVKPHNESQGNGVSLFEKNDDINKIIQTIKQTVRKYGCALLQTRINSTPIYNSENERLDWNIRVLLSSNGVIDTAVRIGKKGNNPINGHLGATAQNLFDTLNNLHISPTNKQKLKAELVKTLENLCLRSREILGGGEYLGFDIMVDERLNPWIIEVNGGVSGGITYLAQIRGENGKLKAANRFLEKLSIERGLVPSNLDFPDIDNPAMFFEDHHTGRLINTLILYLSKIESKENKLTLLKEIILLIDEKSKHINLEHAAIYLKHAFKVAKDLDNKFLIQRTASAYKKLFGKDDTYKKILAESTILGTAIQLTPKI